MKKLHMMFAMSLLMGMQQAMGMNSEEQEKHKELVSAIVSSAKHQKQVFGPQSSSHSIARSEDTTDEALARAFIEASKKPKFQRDTQNFNIRVQRFGSIIMMHFAPKDNSPR